VSAPPWRSGHKPCGQASGQVFSRPFPLPFECDRALPMHFCSLHRSMAEFWQSAGFWAETLMCFQPGKFFLCHCRGAYDQGRPPFWSIVLAFAFTLSAFYAQRFWLKEILHNRVRKGDSGIHPHMPNRPWPIPVFISAGVWALFHYRCLCDDRLMAPLSSFWGVNNTPDHF